MSNEGQPQSRRAASLTRAEFVGVAAFGVCLFASGLVTGRASRDAVQTTGSESPRASSFEDYQRWMWDRHPEWRFEPISIAYGVPEATLPESQPTLHEAEEAGADRACVDGEVYARADGRWQRFFAGEPDGSGRWLHRCTSNSPELLAQMRAANAELHGSTRIANPPPVGSTVIE